MANLYTVPANEKDTSKKEKFKKYPKNDSTKISERSHTSKKSSNVVSLYSSGLFISAQIVFKSVKIVS